MSAKFKSVLRNDGYHWLAVDTPTRLIYLYRMGRIGQCFDSRGWKNPCQPEGTP